MREHSRIDDPEVEGWRHGYGDPDPDVEMVDPDESPDDDPPGVVRGTE
ncbi:hypothetical protein [Nocardioides ungokensis]|nr:hypothetical protein [Nocardioides ungokensis]